MAIEAKLKQGPKGYGLPQSFSMTGDHKSEIEAAAAVFVRGTKFVGFAEGEGGHIEPANDQLSSPTDILAGTTQNVTILFRDKGGTKFQRAIYEVKGT